MKTKRPHRTFAQTAKLHAKLAAALLANKTVKQAAHEAGITSGYAYRIVAMKLRFAPVFLSPSEQALIQFSRAANKKGGRK